MPLSSVHFLKYTLVSQHFGPSAFIYRTAGKGVFHTIRQSGYVRMNDSFFGIYFSDLICLRLEDGFEYFWGGVDGELGEGRVR